MATTKKFRMVAFDLDGTLLGPTHQISDDAVQYLRSLHERGFIVSIATGRSPAAIAEVIRQLNFDFPKPHSKSFPVVSTNGAKGLHVSHGSFLEDLEEERQLMSKSKSKSNGEQPLELKWENNPMVDGRMQITEMFHQPVPKDLAHKTLKLAMGMGCPVNYYIGHDIYAQLFEDWNLEATQKYSNLTGVKFTYCKDEYREAMGRGLPSKLLVLCKPEDIDTTYQKIDEALGHELKIIRGSPPFFIEILNKDVCKGNGLELLCQKLGVGLHECM